MIGVEDRAGRAQVELVLRLLRPRQLRHPFEVGADQVAIGGVGGERLEPPELALGLRLRGGGKVGGLDLLAQLLDLAQPGVAVADLALDVAHAAAQQALALLGIDLGVAGLTGEHALRLGDRRLALEMPRDAIQAPDHVRLREQRELLFRRQGQRRADHVREQPRVRDPGHEALPLVGIIVVEIDHALRELDDALPHRIARGGLALDVGHGIQTHQQGGALGERGAETRPRDADHDRLLALLTRVDHPHHARDAADRVQIVDAGILDARFALGRDDQEAAAAGAFQGGERLGPADRERDRDAREDDQISHREHRQDGRDLDALLAGSQQTPALSLRAALFAVRTRHPRGWKSQSPKLIAEGGRSSFGGWNCGRGAAWCPGLDSNQHGLAATRP